MRDIFSELRHMTVIYVTFWHDSHVSVKKDESVCYIYRPSVFVERVGDGG